jgi:hypothetical protein
LSLAAIVLFAAISLLNDRNVRTMTHPIEWLLGLDQATQSSMLFSASQIVAGVLAISITVSAIIVELAANRYNHRITLLFVREPINKAVMSLFVVTTLLCIWIATAYGADNHAAMHPAAFATTMLLVSVSLLALLPYFVWVFAFLSPFSVIEKITDTAYRAIRAGSKRGEGALQRRVAEAVDELHDVARSAIEQSDRGIAMACVNALGDLLERYASIRDSLPAPWFDARDVAMDPDFVSLAPSALQEIDDRRLWFEVKVFRQYLSLVALCVPQIRDVAYVVAIETRRIGANAAQRHFEPLLELCIRCFNSYLRRSINAADPRTAYYMMDQYRSLAEEMLRQSHPEAVGVIARHFRSYGQLAHKMGQSFLLEVAAYDIVTLIEAALGIDEGLGDDLLGVLLELDQEIRSETQEDSLLNVRRAQIQLATLFLVRGDQARAQRIVNDLRGEKHERLLRIRAALEGESRPLFWELDERGVNFGYLAPERRAKLPTLFQMLDSPAVSRVSA